MLDLFVSLELFCLSFLFYVALQVLPILLVKFCNLIIGLYRRFTYSRWSFCKNELGMYSPCLTNLFGVQRSKSSFHFFPHILFFYFSIYQLIRFSQVLLFPNSYLSYLDFLILGRCNSLQHCKNGIRSILSFFNLLGKSAVWSNCWVFHNLA